MLGQIAMAYVEDPRNAGPLEHSTHFGSVGTRGDGPFMEVWLRIEGETIHDAAYRTYGCRSAELCGAVLAVVLRGRTVTQARAITAEDISRLAGGVPEGKEHCPKLAADALMRALSSEEKARNG